MKFVMFNGPSCVGKSTTAQCILDKKEGVFHLSYDKLKWSFSLYSHRIHGKDIHELMNVVTRTVCGMQRTIICDSGLHKSGREELFNIARKFDYEILEINLEADWSAIEQRFEERLEHARMHPNEKISNTSKDRLKELFDTYHAEKNPNAVTFRTDKQTIGEIAEEVMKLI